MNTVGRLRSDGVLFANLFDEFSSPSRNVSVDQFGVFYSNTMKEGSFSQLTSSVPMRIVNNKEASFLVCLRIIERISSIRLRNP